MLKLAAKHFLTGIGDHSFVPNPDHLEWDDVKCLDLAVKRKAKWFWQKDIYTYDHFGLNDILITPLPNDLTPFLRPPELISSKYSWSSKHDVKGELGGKIASLACLDLSTDDSIIINVDLEGIVKESIDFAAVTHLLNKKKVDLNCPYIHHLAFDKHIDIYMVTQYIYLTQQTEVKVSIDLKIEEQASDTTKTVTNEADAQSQVNKSIIFDPGTRLAFDFVKLVIAPDGTIDLIRKSEDHGKQRSIPNILKAPVCSSNSVSDRPIPDAVKEEKPPHLSENNIKPVQSVNDNNNFDMRKNLLALALDEKPTLKKFELFLLKYQQNFENDENNVDLTLFKLQSNENPDLSALMERMEINVKNPDPIVKISKLSYDLASSILLKIQSIYHMEIQYLQNVRDIIANCDSQTVANLVSYLENLEKANQSDSDMFDKLVQDNRIKLMLLTIGVLKDKQELNQYFHPHYNLLKIA